VCGVDQQCVGCATDDDCASGVCLATRTCALAEKYPRSLQLSAKRPADVAQLRDQLIEHFIGKLEEVELDVPWTHQRVIHLIHERTTVLAETHHDDGTRVRLRAPAGVIASLRESLTADAP
jgi:GTPase